MITIDDQRKPPERGRTITGLEIQAGTTFLGDVHYAFRAVSGVFLKIASHIVQLEPGYTLIGCGKRGRSVIVKHYEPVQARLVLTEQNTNGPSEAVVAALFGDNK